MLLYGPPGTGKTLMARQIGKILNGKEPKVWKLLLILVVNLNKYICIKLLCMQSATVYRSYNCNFFELISII